MSTEVQHAGVRHCRPVSTDDQTESRAMQERTEPDLGNGTFGT